MEFEIDSNDTCQYKKCDYLVYFQCEDCSDDDFDISYEIWKKQYNERGE